MLEDMNMSATRTPDTEKNTDSTEKTVSTPPASNSDSDSYSGSPMSLLSTPSEYSSRGDSFTSASSIPLFTLEEPSLQGLETTVSLHTRQASLRRVGSETFDLDSDSEEPEESEETKEQTWLNTNHYSVNNDSYKKGMIVLKEPLAQIAQTPSPHPEETASTTTFQFGASEFNCDERSIIEAKFSDKASIKAFREADELIQKLQTLSDTYKSKKSTMTAPATRQAAIQEALTPFLGGTVSPIRPQKKIDQNKKSALQTTHTILKTMRDEERKNENMHRSAPAKQKKQAVYSTSLIEIIQQYSHELENNNSTVIYRQPNKRSYDPMVFLPFKIRREDFNNNADFVGLKISPWTTGGVANDLKSSELRRFGTFIIASCMFGSSIVGRDEAGGSFPMVKHDIKLFEKQNITSIQVGEVSFYEEAQFEIFKIAIAPFMLQTGNKNEQHLQLRSTNPEDSETAANPNHLYLYQENDEIFYASKSEKGTVRAKVKKSDFKHKDYFDALLTTLKKVSIDQETIDDTIKEELFEIASKRDHIPKDFKVVCHLPYIDYILFGVRLYVEGIMTKNALGAYSVAVLRKKEELSRRLHKVFPKELGIELIIGNPIDNLFDTKELIAILKAKRPTRNADISTFILEQLQLSTDENTFQKLGEDETTIEQAKIVQRCLSLLMTNSYNPTQAIVWRDFAKAAATMNSSPTTLEGLLKIANAVMVGVGCHGMEPNQACTLQPTSEKPIQTTFDKFSQKANEHDLTFHSFPEGKELTPEMLATAEENATPILAKIGDKYSIYGLRDDKWQETKLTSLSKDALRTLNKLKAENSHINKDVLKGPLLEIIKMGHTPRYPFAFCVTYFDPVTAYQFNDLNGTKQRAGISFYYGDYQDGAARLVKTHPCFLLNGLRNGARPASDPAQTSLKQADIRLGKRL